MASSTVDATWTSRRSPRFDRAITAFLAALGALPSLMWALSRPSLLTDDFAHLQRLRTMGVIDAAWSWSFVHPARPLVGPYHVLVYGVIGDRPIAQALLMAVLNGFVVALLWVFGRRWLSPEVALAAAVLYAVVPNRDSTRFWFATGNYLLAVIVALVAAHLLLDRRRLRSAAALFAAATLLFEGAVGLVGGIVLLWVLRAPAARVRTGAAVLTPTLLAAALIYALSPKRSDASTAGSGLETVGHGLIGSALWGRSLATAGALLVAMLIGAGVAGLLPSFTSWRELTEGFRLGAMLLLATATPLVVAGAVFAVRGTFDRTNAIPLLGVSIILAGAIRATARSALRNPFLVLGIAVCTYLAGMTFSGVRDYVHAADVGRTVIEHTMRDAPRDAELVLVGPVPDDSEVIAPFVLPGDLDAALRIEGSEHAGRFVMPASTEQCRRYAEEDVETLGYDWRNREVLRDPMRLCDLQG